MVSLHPEWLVIWGNAVAATFRALSDLGFAPPYHGSFCNGRVEGYLRCRPLEPHELAQVRNGHRNYTSKPIFLQNEPINFQQLIAQQLAQMHGLDVPLGSTEEPVLFSVGHRRVSFKPTHKGAETR